MPGQGSRPARNRANRLSRISALTVRGRCPAARSSPAVRGSSASALVTLPTVLPGPNPQGGLPPSVRLFGLRRSVRIRPRRPLSPDSRGDGGRIRTDRRQEGTPPLGVDRVEFVLLHRLLCEGDPVARRLAGPVLCAGSPCEGAPVAVAWLSPSTERRPGSALARGRSPCLHPHTGAADAHPARPRLRAEELAGPGRRRTGRIPRTRSTRTMPALQRRGSRPPRCRRAWQWSGMLQCARRG
jgi:hypothetical protein